MKGYRPTLDELRRWVGILDGEWGNFKTEQERERNSYFQRFDVPSPGGKFDVKTGSAPSDCNAAIDSLVPTEILIRVKPRRQADKYRPQAEKLTRFGRALINHWSRQRNPFRQIIADMVIKRVGIGRLLVDDTKWPKMPEDMEYSEDPESDYADWEMRNRSCCPLVLERRDPNYVRWREDDTGKLLVVIESYTTTVLEARTAFMDYPEAQRLLKGRELNDPVQVADVWFGPWRCILIEDNPIFPGGRDQYKGILPHGYKEIPYIIAPFRELPFHDPEQRYRGMLSDTTWLYEAESQVLSMYMSMLAWNAWRTYIGLTADGRDFDIQPGKYIPVDPRKGEYLELLGGEPVPPEVLQTAGVLDSYIQRNGVAQGPTTAEGTRSGSQLWAVQAVRQLKIESAKQSAIEMYERVLYLACMEVETLIDGKIVLPIPGKDKEGKDLGEVTMRADDIDGYWDGWTISFGKRLDPALLEQAKALQALSANNWMPMKTSWEMSGLTDSPQEWEDDLLLQATDRLDFMIELLALERIKQEYGPDSWQAQVFQQRMEQAQQSQQGAAQAMPGAPGMAGGGTQQPGSMSGPIGSNIGGSLQPRAPQTRGRTQGMRGPNNRGVSGPTGGPGGMG